MDPVTIGAIIGAGTGLIDRFISRGDIARQNAYNSPKEQLSRLREAGLPMAAMTGISAGNQSVIPEQGNFKGSIAEGMRTSTQMAQIKILKEEARLKASEADLNEARRDFLLSGIGEPIAGTNLTSNLQGEQILQRNQIEGGRIANRISEITARFANQRNLLENTNLVSQIQERLQRSGLIKEEIEGRQIQNKISNVIANYQSRMSHSQWVHLLKQNNLLDEQIYQSALTQEGTSLDNELKRIRNFVEDQTKFSHINMVHTDDLMKQLTWDKIGQEFNDYNEYMEFVRLTRDNLKGRHGLNPIKFVESVLAFAYTSITGLTGQNPTVGQILQGIGQPTPQRTYNTNNYINPK